MNTVAELVVDCRNDLGETPVWCARSRTLSWIDVTYPGRLFRWQTDATGIDCHHFDDLVTGVARHAGGHLLMAGCRELFEFDPATLRRTTLFQQPADRPEHRFNDGGCDRAGRFWVGSMENNLAPARAAQSSLGATGRIYCIDGSGRSRYFEAGLICPNAICWSLDDTTFYIADSGNGWIYSYEFDLAEGALGARKGFCRLNGLGIPDGAAVDVDGCLWNARWGAGVVARIDPTGRLDRVIKVGTTNPTACCFGGSKLDTLYITSARYGLDAARLGSEPHAGGLFAVATGVSGIDKPAFGARP